MKPARRAWVVAAVGGPVFALCSPPFDLLVTVWLGLSLLYCATVDAPRARSAFGRAWLWATTAALLGMRFIPEVVDRFTPLGMAGGLGALLLLAVGQAVPWGLGALVTRALTHHAGVPAPLAFAAGVTFGSSLVLVIGWTPGALVSPWPVMVQLAEFIGERGVTFLIALVAALVVEPLRSRLEGPPRPPRRPVVLALALLSAQLLGGWGLLARETRAHAQRPTLRVGIVQPATEARLRWEPGQRDVILKRLRTLTADAERRGVALTIWPEAAYPYVIPHSEHSMHRGRRAIVGGDVQGPVLFGVLTQAPGGQGRHNSATLIDREGRVQLPQAKMALLWFGETIPLSSVFPILRRWFFRAGGLVPGHDVALLTVEGARIGVLNCFEDTLPSVGRKLARHSPNLLVNVTNDAWFPEPEPEFHLRLSVLRAVELRRDLVRAVNLGAPSFIDSTGRVRLRGDTRVQSVLVATPALNDGPATFFARFGDTLLWLFVFAVTAFSVVRRRRERRELPQ